MVITRKRRKLPVNHIIRTTGTARTAMDTTRMAIRIKTPTDTVKTAAEARTVIRIPTAKLHKTEIARMAFQTETAMDTTRIATGMKTPMDTIKTAAEVKTVIRILIAKLHKTETAKRVKVDIRAIIRSHMEATNTAVHKVRMAIVTDIPPIIATIQTEILKTPTIKVILLHTEIRTVTIRVGNHSTVIQIINNRIHLLPLIIT
jgi:hypothetical protein